MHLMPNLSQMKDKVGQHLAGGAVIGVEITVQENQFHLYFRAVRPEQGFYILEQQE
jgi:hypothetical protein